MADQALSSLKLLECGGGVSAPCCAKLFADLGAEVIKIEEPGTGDFTRTEGPFPGDVPDPEKSGLFLYLNGNKLGITLNLRSARGRSILQALAQKADILVENLAPREAEELGLTYAALEPINPALIVASITPYGFTGPYRDYKGYPLNAFHASGTGFRVGQPEREPLTMPCAQSSYAGGISAAAAIMTAVFARGVNGGLGQQVDVSEMEAEVCFFGSTITGFLAASDEMAVRPRMGHRLSALNASMRCKDGYVHLIATSADWWQRLGQVMGGPDWSQDPFFQDPANREKLADELEALLEPWLMERTREELFQLGVANRIPITPYYTTEEVARLPHLKEREFFVDIEHPAAGMLRYPGAPYKLSETPWAMVRPAPLLGQHNEEIYCGRLGYTREQLASLRTLGII
ncbi:MAG: CoA transferase [Chloroflexi bacterium]|nr:CoA transferase [Chloroflexota bacterium]